MSKGALALFHGIAGLGLSVVMWRLTHNVYAWAVLFGPASAILVYGLYRVFIFDDV
jgi:hypothetical protein